MLGVQPWISVQPQAPLRARIYLEMYRSQGKLPLHRPPRHRRPMYKALAWQPTWQGGGPAQNQLSSSLMPTFQLLLKQRGGRGLPSTLQPQCPLLEHTHTRHRRLQGPELLFENSALFRQRTKASCSDFLALGRHQCGITLIQGAQALPMCLAGPSRK